MAAAAQAGEVPSDFTPFPLHPATALQLDKALAVASRRVTRDGRELAVAALGEALPVGPVKRMRRVGG